MMPVSMTAGLRLGAVLCACWLMLAAASAGASDDAPTTADGPAIDASAAAGAPPAVDSGTATTPRPDRPAPLPPSPRMLDDPRVSSPYLLPAPTLRDSVEDFGADTGDEPLWVLPESAIPTDTGGIPGARMSRELGFLDRPETIQRAGRSDDDALAGRLNAGLDWAYCGPRPTRLGPPETPSPPGPNEPVDVDAGGLTYRQDTEVLELGGGIDVRRGSQRISADAATYNRRTGEIVTRGETFLEYPGLRIIGGSASFNLKTNQGSIPDARYRFSGTANLRGDAVMADLINPDLTRYSRITYTSCPPGVNAWSLRASELELDQVSGRGKARNARLRVKGVPVLYTPYLDFPIDDRRKSGFLIPSVGSSDDNGFELILPYYWNIAPNLDATFYPRYMSERGLMLGGELRWLTSLDDGTIQAEVIKDDRGAGESGGGDSRMRGALHVEQDGRFFQRFRTQIDYSAVSDDEYLQDFGNNLDTSSSRRLRQRGDLTYSGDGWSLLSRVEAYQTVDPSIPPQSRPYGRLPQLLLEVRPRSFGPGLLGSLVAEYDYFDHNHRVHGQRLSFLPILRWPLRRSYGHLIPTLSLHLSSYDLTETAPDQPDSPSHAIPTFNLDGKLVLERSANWLGQPTLQTIEPRLYYLYTPYEDQSQTPVFDSSELTFSFSNLFRSNRFTGRDRIGDANQLSAAITSRMIKASTGEELFRFSVGQVFYFADRQVQINGPVETAATSPYAGELAARLLDNWTGRASFEWDPQEENDPWGRRTVQLEYRSPDNLRLLNLAYRFDQGTNATNRYEDTDVSFRLPLGNRVEMVGRWLYSMLESQTIEAFAGIEFGQCCWKVRLLGRHYRNRPDSPATNSIMLQLELAGLGSFGSPVNTFLEEEIYGYQVQ